MPVITIMSRSLRHVPRHIHKASKQGLYIPRRQLSLFDRFLIENKNNQPSEPSAAPSKASQQPSQFDEFLKLDQQQSSEPSTTSGKDGQPPSQPSAFDQWDQQPSALSAASGKYQDSQSSHQPSQFDEFLPLDQQSSEPSIIPGTDGQPPSALQNFRTMVFTPPAKLSPPETKPHDGHYWQSDLTTYNSSISYCRTPLAAPLIVGRSWLRDSCTCEKCVDPSSGQKNYASSDVPLKLPIRSLTVTKQGELLVHWENDFHTGGTHVSKYSPALWDGTESVEVERIPEPKPWHREQIEDVSPYYPYQSFMTDGPGYRQAMTALSEFGLVFLRGVPSSGETVKDIAARIGVIQDTFYGTTWDVKSKPNAENVAYTNSYLGLHQDLLYMSNVPRIQILHCLENTCLGGESIFSDSYRAAHKFRQIFPEGVGFLTDRKVVYHYNKGGHTYRSERAVLSDLGSSKLGVYWSPPFQSPVQADERTTQGMNNYKRWHKMARRMKHLLEDDDAVYKYKMKPGECVIFDNRRVLHGRRAFDTSSGERWLKGAYVENDSYNSRIRSLKLVSESGDVL